MGSSADPHPRAPSPPRAPEWEAGTGPPLSVPVGLPQPHRTHPGDAQPWVPLKAKERRGGHERAPAGFIVQLGRGVQISMGGAAGALAPVHVPPWLPHSGPRCCHPLPPHRANLPQPCAILSCHQPQLPPCTVHSTVPPAPRPSQQLLHSPLPTSSSLPRLQELTHSLPQPPTAPGPPARQLACL